MTYAAYVWSSYGLVFAVLALNFVRSYRYYRTIRRKVGANV